ncbi:MAG: hypothetical protein IKM44_01825 [Clostridia bacterium]|nr:hypothetical protein [Clostridia bacterium]
MKKIIFTTLVAIIATLFVCGCSQTNIEKYSDKISDYRYVFMEAETEDFRIEGISGKRETPFAPDDVCSSKKTDYTVFTVTPYSGLLSGEKGELTFSQGETEVTLTLTRHPFKKTYSAETSLKIEPSAEEGLTITVCGKTVTLYPRQPEIESEYAFTLALEQVGSRLNTWNNYEIYIRLSENTVTMADGLYWVITFNHDETTTSVLVSADDGEITAVRG